MNRLRLRLLIGLVVAVALAWGATLDLNAAAKAAAKATAKVVRTATATTPAATTTTTATPAPAAPTTAAAPAPAPQGKSKNQTGTACKVNGKTVDPCPPALLKQSKRLAARQSAAPQKKGVAVTFAGVSLATASKSPLAPVTALGAGATIASFSTQPDYFAIGNYANSPFPVITGGVVSGGIRKFVDTLPGICNISPWGTAGVNNLGQCLPLATPDTATFGGSDFYRIGIREFNEQMHSDLPPVTGSGLTGGGTYLRGYVQLDNTNTPIGANHYLGPLILATRNRPVRLLYKNMLSTELNIPVDTTYMGAGAVDDGKGNSVLTTTSMRAAVHLHGGNTPWISDGTPHQWITPAGGAGQPAARGFQKGFSFQNVPDMVGPTSPLSELTAPTFGDGLGTNFYTNQQSGRLMFYHEHAYGTTRLGVYDGLAAGYLLVDPAQEAALAAATAPGTIVTDPTTGLITSADLNHVVPLVIQDKTFVPDTVNQLPAQDPTWDLVAGGGLGNLWFPHVYMPNQNPADVTGANGFGRWDYGPWFFPPQVSSTFVGQPYQCSSAAYTTANPPAFPPLICPGTPLPSGTPESFMDTPVVNGTAYPTMPVAPAAYRFQVLNAANDRGLNLGLYVAEPVTLSPIITAPGSGYTNPTVTIGGCTGGTAYAQVGDGIDPATKLPFTAGIVGITMGVQPSACTAPTFTIADTAPGTGSGASASAVMSQNSDVHMVPAIPATAGRSLPNCSQKAPMAGGGQITAILDNSGNPLNGTGLPANCWPMYSSAQGYTAGTFGENGGQLSWGNSDARTGGVPDPTTAGPPIIQIGAEGGVLPQIAVIPSTPVSYDYNKRSITVLNVLNHGLWLGPAERADIIVDFTAFNGKTLILYNDAPAPIPAGDPRIDYYTNDPDQSSTGGAPSTLAGYGPNMRTIMQFKVTETNPNTPTFSLPTLSGQIPAIFTAAQAQEPPILAEPVYPAGLGHSATPTYVPIQATSLNAWVGGGIGGITLTSGGGGYTSIPGITIDPPCTPYPACGGVQAQASLTLGSAAVASVNLAAPNFGGFGYLTAPVVSFSGGGGTGVSATALLGNGGVRSITVTAGGSGYTQPPQVLIAAPPVGGTQATATATVQASGQRRVTAITVTNPGSGYTTAPVVQIVPAVLGAGSGATATSALGARVTGFTVVGGSGYSTPPTVTVAAPPSSNCVPSSLCKAATATAALAPRVVFSATVTNPGSGYSAAPVVTIDPPPAGGTQATAVATAPNVPLLPKTIQELFTLDYGRMNATLGVEVPFTNFLTQTTIPYGYTDPPTEIFKDGETQLWKITHNGVDTHFIHFHLFTVQVINRVGWDGAIKPPDPYELGMKDTVRMNPLEDIIIALRPFKQQLPFAVPNSNRPMDVTHPTTYQSTMTFTNIDPANNPATVTNDSINFGWEYVWHCHILGHEENDMMRAQIFAVAPAAPTVTAAAGPKKGQITLTMSTPTGQVGYGDPTGFTIQRATSANGPWTSIGTLAATGSAACTVNGLPATCATATFTDTNLTSKTTYFYRVVASNVVGYTQAYAAPAIGYPHPSADSAMVVTNGVIAP